MSPSPYSDSPEPVSRLIPIVVLLAAGVVAAGLYSLRAERMDDRTRVPAAEQAAP